MSEHIIQRTFFDWVKWNSAKYPELNLFYAIPNGGKRSIITATRLKAEGVRAGVPDCVLPVARHEFNALYIEFKNGKKGVISESQREFMDKLSAHGNFTAVCRSADEAIELVRWYLT